MSLVLPTSLSSADLGAVAASRARGGAGRATVWLTRAAIAALFAVSAMALVALGIPYAAAGGSFVSKIHPATWIAVFALLAAITARGGVGRWAAEIVLDTPGVAIFTLAVGLLFVHVAVVQRLPLAAIVDSFALPIFLFALLGAVGSAERATIGRAVHLFLAVNAAIGLVEYATGWRVTPMYDIDGTIIVDWRSTAILGHPLNNAFATGLWLVMLATGAARSWRPMLRLAAMALAAVALVAFGGRVAMVLAYALVALVGVLGGLRLLAGRRFDLVDAAVLVGLGTGLALAVVILVDLGAADRLIDRFVDDSGSAGTRVAMLNIFTDLTWEQFLFGPPPDHIAAAQRVWGLRIGIESTEVAFVAFYGLLMTIIVLGALGGFLAELVRATGPGGLWAVGFFVTVMSGSTGLSSKSPGLAIFTVMILTLMPTTVGRNHRR